MIKGGGGNRPAYVAAIGIILLLICAGYTSYNTQYSNSNIRPNQVIADASQPVLERPVVGWFPPPQSPDYTYYEDQIERYDLIAQRWMAWLTGVIAVLTGLGIVLIWRTLIESNEILKEAKKTTLTAQKTFFTYISQ